MLDHYLIEDGYTIDARIPRAEGIHPELRFAYRPALSAEVHSHFKAAAGDKTIPARVRLVVDHVKAWNVTGRDGKPVDKLMASAVERLQPMLLDKLVDVILGYAASGEEATDAKN